MHPYDDDISISAAEPRRKQHFVALHGVACYKALGHLPPRSDAAVICGHKYDIYIVGQHGVLCEVKWWRFVASFE